MASEGLSGAAIEQFRLDGVLGPVSTYAPDEAERKFTPIREAVSRVPRDLPTGAHKTSWLPHVRNRHFDLPAVAELCFHPAIVAGLTSLLGPDLVLWRSNLFVQGVGVGLRINWHQDEYLELLAPPRTNLSVHVAVTAATEQNCVVVLPGSHRLTREEIREKHGLRFREGSDRRGDGTPGYDASPEVQQALAANGRRMTLAPGEFFIFHPSLLHASNLGAPDTQDDHTRIGVAVRVATPSVRVLPAAFGDVVNPSHRCVLLNGVDRDEISDVDRDFSPAAVAQQ